MVFFWHQYITQPTVMHKDQMIKVVGDLFSALRHQVNIHGKEKMAVLQKMNDILNNTTTVTVEQKKNVTPLCTVPISGPTTHSNMPKWPTLSAEDGQCKANHQLT
jgi:hypothetical protein